MAVITNIHKELNVVLITENDTQGSHQRSKRSAAGTNKCFGDYAMQTKKRKQPVDPPAKKSVFPAATNPYEQFTDGEAMSVWEVVTDPAAAVSVTENDTPGSRRRPKRSAAGTNKYFGDYVTQTKRIRKQPVDPPVKKSVLTVATNLDENVAGGEAMLVQKVVTDPTATDADTEQVTEPDTSVVSEAATDPTATEPATSVSEAGTAPNMQCAAEHVLMAVADPDRQSVAAVQMDMSELAGYVISMENGMPCTENGAVVVNFPCLAYQIPVYDLACDQITDVDGSVFVPLAAPSPDGTCEVTAGGGITVLSSPVIPEVMQNDYIVEQTVEVTSDPTAQMQRRKIAKRGMADPSKWKKNARAISRMKGEGRVLKPARCSCCKDKFDKNARKQIFTQFWEVDWKRKKDFVIGNTEVKETARKTVGGNSRRKHTVNYFLPSAQGRQRVCKQNFLETLGVGVMFVRWTLKTARTFAPAHGCTKRPPANKTPAALRVHVKNFIKRFPTLPSHYCRRDSKLLYLEPGLTLSRMYDLYKKEADDAKQRCVSKKIFSAIFRELNLSFHNPRKDQCDTCARYKEHGISQDIYDKHIENKERARYFKAQDKELAANDQARLKVVTMDLEQLLLCPKSFSSSVYYKRKLSVHNFTIYDVASKDGQCYLWHEGEGGLDSDEFATIVVDYLMSVPDSTESVIIWSDGCTYQNRNSTLSSAILHTLQGGQKPNLKEVQQKYLTRGHTQMEVDSMHAAIETNSSRIEIYTPGQWETVIKTARRNNPYHVKTVDHTFWKQFPVLRTSIRPGKVAGDPTVTDICHLCYTKSGIFYALSHGTPVQPLPAIRQSRNPPNPVQQMKYKQKLSLSSAKIADLKSLCDTIVPESHRGFYQDLF